MRASTNKGRADVAFQVKFKDWYSKGLSIAVVECK